VHYHVDKNIPVDHILRQRAPVHVLALCSLQIIQMYVLSIIWNGEVRRLYLKGHAQINLYNITLLGRKLDKVPVVYLCFS
jgi:hypothetical protein